MKFEKPIWENVFPNDKNLKKLINYTYQLPLKKKQFLLLSWFKKKYYLYILFRQLQDK